MSGSLQVGGLVPFTTTDWPGRLSAVVFCQGCPWRCGYCHNPHLIPACKGGLPWEQVVDFLRRRTGRLEAVVFSGGEATLHADLPQAMDEVRTLGFAVGLHTAGPYPDRLAQVLPKVDWVGMDLKAPFGRYGQVTGVPGGGAGARLSAGRLIASGKPHEFRTTWHPNLLTEEEVMRIAEGLAAMGGRRFVLQPFRAAGCADAALAAGVPSREEVERLLARLREVLPEAQLRE